MKGNKLYAELDGHNEPVSDSSKSSVKSTNKAMRFTKKHVRVTPRAPLDDSSSSSSKDTEEDLLPDLFYTPYQPEDNDSSDYDHDERHGEDDSAD